MSGPWVEWSPAYAPHVVGSYERDREVGPSGMPDAQQIRAVCNVCKANCKCPRSLPCGCGAEWRGSCNSGAVRQHISRFAALHLHRDVFKVPPPHL